MLKPTDLANLLAKIPACPDEDCETLGKCCHVSVIIESCYAGNFNVPGVTGQGRTVVGTSINTPSWATYRGGGVYTQGFDKDSRDPASDTNQDSNVDPMEANVTAVDAVNTFNGKYGKSQAPWSNSQECECKCPCKVSVGAEKTVWDDVSQQYVDETQAQLGEFVYFRLEIENDGKCCNLTGLQIIDFLPSGLEYYPEEVTIWYHGEPFPGEPDEIIPGEMEIEVVFNLEEIEALAPGEHMAIVYKATAVELGPNINELSASAHCSVDPSKVVSDEDTATVIVVES